MSRTISVPQKAGALSDPVLYEALSRVVSGVNLALTLPMLPSAPISASGTISLSNPVARISGTGVVRTIASVDFGVPIYLIAATGPVTLDVGGNIGSAVTIATGTVCALVWEDATKLWWPISSGSSGALSGGAEEFHVQTVTIDSTNKVIALADDKDFLRSSSSSGCSLSSVTITAVGGGARKLTVYNLGPYDIIINYANVVDGFLFQSATNYTLIPGYSVGFFRTPTGRWLKYFTT